MFWRVFTYGCHRYVFFLLELTSLCPSVVFSPIYSPPPTSSGQFSSPYQSIGILASWYAQSEVVCSNNVFGNAGGWSYNRAGARQEMFQQEIDGKQDDWLRQATMWPLSLGMWCVRFERSTDYHTVICPKIQDIYYVCMICHSQCHSTEYKRRWYTGDKYISAHKRMNMGSANSYDIQQVGGVRSMRVEISLLEYERVNLIFLFV